MGSLAILVLNAKLSLINIHSAAGWYGCKNVQVAKGYLMGKRKGIWWEKGDFLGHESYEVFVSLYNFFIVDE